MERRHRTSGHLARAAAAWLAAGWASAGPSAFAAPPAAGRTPPRGGDPVAAMRGLVATPTHDDLDGLLRRGLVRVAVTYSKTHFFVDRGQHHGLAYENLVEFERFLRKRHASARSGKTLSVVFMPVPRDELLERLEDGRADMAVANLTVTPERSARVAFTRPMYTAVREVVVSHPGVAAPTSLEGLSGLEVVVRPSSSFREHLEALNERLLRAGLEPVRIVPADEHLEVEDLLEMVNAGLIDYTVADEHSANLWSEIFQDLRVHRDVAVATGGRIAWAVRKDAPRLLAEADAFVASHRYGTTFGNVLLQRYLKDPYWARRALDENEIDKFKALVGLFRRYGDRYGFDHLLLMAQAYQESGLDHARTSAVGAVGIMQLMPATGQAMRVGDIRQLEPNVHAGAKYLQQIIAQNFSDPAISEANRTLFGFAAYNAGPGRIQALRRRAAAAGLDPNVWFGHVESVAARAIGPETVTYVSNISKYYLAYRMVENRRRERAEAEASVR